MSRPTPGSIAAAVSAGAARRLAEAEARRVQDPILAEEMAYTEVLYSTEVLGWTMEQAEAMAHHEARSREVAQQRQEAREADLARQAADIAKKGERMRVAEQERRLVLQRTQVAEEYQGWLDGARTSKLLLDAYLNELAETLAGDERTQFDSHLQELRTKADRQSMTLPGYLNWIIGQRQEALTIKRKKDVLRAQRERHQERLEIARLLREQNLQQATEHGRLRREIAQAPAADEKEAIRRERCPRPEKIAYLGGTVGRLAAQLHLEGLRADGSGRDARVYGCDCQWLHVGKNSALLSKRVQSQLNLPKKSR